MVDYQSRIEYLYSLAKTQQELSDEIGLSRRTIRRVITNRDKKGAKKPYNPSQATKDRIDALYQKKASNAVKKKEKKYGKASPRLLKYDDAIQLENFYKRNGIKYMVSGQTVEFTYELNVGGNVTVRTKTLYRGNTTVRKTWRDIKNYYREWIEGELMGSPEITIIDPPPPFDLIDFTYFRIYRPKKVER